MSRQSHRGGGVRFAYLRAPNLRLGNGSGKEKRKGRAHYRTHRFMLGIVGNSGGTNAALPFCSLAEGGKAGRLGHHVTDPASPQAGSERGTTGIRTHANPVEEP